MTTDDVTVAILGAGSWGTTFAKVLADAATERDEAIDIRLWARRQEIVRATPTTSTVNTSTTFNPRIHRNR